jgi:hypothetical protein
MNTNSGNGMESTGTQGTGSAGSRMNTSSYSPNNDLSGRMSAYEMNNASSMNTASLPVTQNLVPADVVSRAKSTHGTKLYDITAVKGASGQDVYVLRTIESGQATTHWVGQDGSAVTDMFRTETDSSSMNNGTNNSPAGSGTSTGAGSGSMNMNSGTNTNTNSGTNSSTNTSTDNGANTNTNSGMNSNTNSNSNTNLNTGNNTQGSSPTMNSSGTNSTNTNSGNTNNSNNTNNQKTKTQDSTGNTTTP